jgi:hypothetical protein
MACFHIIQLKQFAYYSSKLLSLQRGGKASLWFTLAGVTDLDAA